MQERQPDKKCASTRSAALDSSRRSDAS